MSIGASIRCVTGQHKMDYKHYYIPLLETIGYTLIQMMINQIYLKASQELIKQKQIIG